MVRSASRSGPQAEESGPVGVQLAINPPTKCQCPLLFKPAQSVRQTSATDAGPEDDCRLVIGTGEETAFTTAKIGEQCLCPIFDDHDCVWEIVDVDGDRLRFKATVPDRGTLAPLVGELENSGATVTTEQLLSTVPSLDETNLLTDAQREAFLVALERGYYEQPRGTTLDEIGDALGISKSAVSKRLAAARNRIAKKYVAQYDDPEDLL